MVILLLNAWAVGGGSAFPGRCYFLPVAPWFLSGFVHFIVPVWCSGLWWMDWSLNFFLSQDAGGKSRGFVLKLQPE